MSSQANAIPITPSSITPTFMVRGAQVRIRLYDENSSSLSDTSSTTGDDSSIEGEHEQLSGNLQDYLDEKLQKNKECLTGRIRERAYNCTTITEGGGIMALWETASQLSHNVIHPYLYLCLQRCELDELARLVFAPEDWRTLFDNIVVVDPLVTKAWDWFCNLPSNTLEVRVENSFSKLRFTIGGILAHSQYNISGKRDYTVQYGSRRLLATEAKTAESFILKDYWYRKSRSIQTLSALYTTGAPTLLYTPQQWKLFVENSDRTEILTYPFGTDEDFDPPPEGTDESMEKARHSTLCGLTEGLDFLKVITICLLSQRGREPVSANTLAVTIAESSRLSGKSTKPPKDFTPHKPLPRTSDRTGGPQNSTTSPKFISGYDAAGEPVWTTVRIVPEEEVMGMETEFDFVSDNMDQLSI
ncbi:hypothetical protein BC829DRAFT_380939 [Chytridium lagenaria]|nr:hypothetical protein BC829DRAFT_380939 [Chytridium lagenaria]